MCVYIYIYIYTSSIRCGSPPPAMPDAKAVAKPAGKRAEKKAERRTANSTQRLTAKARPLRPVADSSADTFSYEPFGGCVFGASLVWGNLTPFEQDLDRMLGQQSHGLSRETGRTFQVLFMEGFPPYDCGV